jgi:hypothetical protein
MAEILVQGGNAEAAARAMCAAVHEIFETDPLASTRGGSLPGTRGLAELAVIVLSIPPGVFYARRLAEDLRRLVYRAEKEAKANGARLMIDCGDGKPIPLEEAHRAKVVEALKALQEKRPKN